jgi:tetratricopeptide (TPR) repeat protein
MKEEAKACPTRQELEALLASSQPDASLEAAWSHVSECATCRSRLDLLSDDTELRSRIGVRRDTADWPRERLARYLNFTLSVSPARASADPISFDPPTVDGDLGSLGSYRVLALLGSGGMGIVYRGYDPALGRDVAIKVIRPERFGPAARERLLREAQAAARFRHEHAVSVHAVGADHPTPYIVMELVEGPTLSARLRAEKRLPPAEAVRIVSQVGAALAAAHAVGLVHRDVKPSNIILEGKSGGARLVDFGLAQLTAQPSGLTAEGQVAGTAEYLSPEQVEARDQVDGRSDVYSLGVTLYEMLTGTVPFQGTLGAVLRQVASNEARPPRQLNDAIPADLETICLKALSKEPADRYATAGLLVDDLGRWQRGEPILARPAGPLERGWRWCRRNRRVALLSGGMLGMLLVLAVGSTVASILIGRSHAEAEHKREEAEAATAKAEQAARVAQEAQTQAAANARAAGAHFALALETIHTLVDRAQGQLEKGGTLSLRKDLLVTALDGLEKIAASAEKTPTSNLQLVQAHTKLGHLFFRLDERDKARHQFERGRDLAQALLHDDPDNLELRFELTHLLEALGNVLLYAGRTPEAARVYGAALKELDEIARIQPHSPRARFDMAQLCGRLGDVHKSNGKLDEAQAQYRRAITLLETGSWPSEMQHDVSFGVGYEYYRLGMLDLAWHDFTSAIAHLQAAVGHRETALELSPAPHLRVHLSTTLFAYGNACAAQGDRPAAQAAFRRAVQIMEPVHQSNRDDPQVVWAWAESCSLWARAQRYGPDAAAARAAADKALSALEAAPSRQQTLPVLATVLRASHTLAELDEEEGHYAEAVVSLDRVARLVRALTMDDPAEHALVELGARRAVNQEAATSGLEQPESWTSRPRLIRWGLFRLRGLAQLRQGKYAEAAASAQQAIAGDETEADLLAAVAQIQARCRVAARSDLSVSETYQAEAMNTLRRCLARDRSWERIAELRLDPDVDAVYRVLLSSK